MDRVSSYCSVCLQERAAAAQHHTHAHLLLKPDIQQPKGCALAALCLVTGCLALGAATAAGDAAADLVVVVCVEPSMVMEVLEVVWGCKFVSVPYVCAAFAVFFAANRFVHLIETKTA